MDTYNLHSFHFNIMITLSPVLVAGSSYKFIVSSSSVIGHVPLNPRKVNQDRFWNEDLKNDDTGCVKYIGVADGHGMNGHDVAELLRKNLPSLVGIQADLIETPKTALSKAHADMSLMIKKSKIETSFSGTTSTSVLIVGDLLLCANVGDSRAILGYSDKGIDWRLKPLSRDHKPDEPVEKARILASGGRVMSYKGANGVSIGPPRVWLKNQDSPGLAMSRSFGDAVAATVGITSEPEITEHTLGPLDKIVIVASDGVWEFVSNDEAMAIVSPHYRKMNPELAVEQLCARARYRWQDEEEVVDDITAVILFRYHS
jgi:serine/threonine protein phosphatase PrpC